MPLVDKADIVFHYAPQTRSFRMLWFLEELGRDYRIALVDYANGGHKRPEYLKLNPMGKVPTIVDHGVPIAETGAIMIYLADKYSLGALAPCPDDERRADYLRWLFFAAGVMEPAFGEKFFKWEIPASKVAWGDFSSMERTVTEAVVRTPWLLGETFSSADVFVGSNLHWGIMWKLFPSEGVLADYVARCAERPALKRALAIEERFIKEQQAAKSA
jgi:glutathione S-transferase